MWVSGPVLYRCYKDAASYKMTEWDNLALFQKEAWEKAAKKFIEVIYEEVYEKGGE